MLTCEGRLAAGEHQTSGSSRRDKMLTTFRRMSHMTSVCVHGILHLDILTCFTLEHFRYKKLNHHFCRVISTQCNIPNKKYF